MAEAWDEINASIDRYVHAWGNAVLENLGEQPMKFYSEDQPREPEGVPEGGEWVEYPDGGAIGSSPVGEHSTEKYAENQRQRLLKEGFTSAAIGRMWGALEYYRDVGYKPINQELRKGNVTAKADAMIRATKVLPTLKGGTLWRCTSMPVEVVDKMERTGSFRTRQFLSVSESRSVAKGFEDDSYGGKRAVTFEIEKHSSAVSINAWGPRWVQNEREAVFPPGSKFKVTGFSRNKWSGDVHVKLRQIR